MSFIHLPLCVLPSLLWCVSLPLFVPCHVCMDEKGGVEGATFVISTHSPTSSTWPCPSPCFPLGPSIDTFAKDLDGFGDSYRYLGTLLSFRHGPFRRIRARRSGPSDASLLRLEDTFRIRHGEEDGRILRQPGGPGERGRGAAGPVGFHGRRRRRKRASRPTGKDRVRGERIAAAMQSGRKQGMGVRMGRGQHTRTSQGEDGTRWKRTTNARGTTGTAQG
eukprot:scaffold694_cov338-Pavlova_lutheri.AAC.12